MEQLRGRGWPCRLLLAQNFRPAGDLIRLETNGPPRSS
jgi:hypothetical protein